jgi:hypothetical protein
MAEQYQYQKAYSYEHDAGDQGMLSAPANAQPTVEQLTEAIQSSKKTLDQDVNKAWRDYRKDFNSILVEDKGATYYFPKEAMGDLQKQLGEYGAVTATALPNKDYVKDLSKFGDAFDDRYTKYVEDFNRTLDLDNPYADQAMDRHSYILNSGGAGDVNTYNALIKDGFDSLAKAGGQYYQGTRRDTTKLRPINTRLYEKLKVRAANNDRSAIKRLAEMDRQINRLTNVAALRFSSQKDIVNRVGVGNIILMNRRDDVVHEINKSLYEAQLGLKADFTKEVKKQFRDQINEASELRASLMARARDVGKTMGSM